MGKSFRLLGDPAKYVPSVKFLICFADKFHLQRKKQARVKNLTHKKGLTDEVGKARH